MGESPDCLTAPGIFCDIKTNPMKYEIQINGSGTPEEIIDALNNTIEGLRSSYENVGTSKGKFPTGDFEDPILCMRISQLEN